MLYVSPNITDQEWASGAKDDVDVFADQLQGWLFDQARALANGQHAGPAILALVTPYFEVTQSYTTAKRAKTKAMRFLRPDYDRFFRRLLMRLSICISLKFETASHTRLCLKG